MFNLSEFLNFYFIVTEDLLAVKNYLISLIVKVKLSLKMNSQIVIALHAFS